MNDIWFIADTHFGHKNIIQYENRPFSNIEIMDRVIIDNWNRLVKPEDTIYHLGDVFFCGQQRKKEIMEQLNGHKKLITGNHDKDSINKYLKLGFEEVWKNSIFFPEYNFVASHWPESLTTYKNIHGHVHSNIQGLDQTRFKCVSVELINYSPIHLNGILKWVRG